MMHASYSTVASGFSRTFGAPDERLVPRRDELGWKTAAYV
jgi:hypothetical protein